MTHRRILSQLNKQGVNFLLEVNKHPRYRDQVRIEAMALNDAKKAYLRTLFSTSRTQMGRPCGRTRSTGTPFRMNSEYRR